MFFFFLFVCRGYNPPSVSVRHFVTWYSYVVLFIFLWCCRMVCVGVWGLWVVCFCGCVFCRVFFTFCVFVLLCVCWVCVFLFCWLFILIVVVCGVVLVWCLFVYFGGCCCFCFFVVFWCVCCVCFFGFLLFFRVFGIYL